MIHTISHQLGAEIWITFIFAVSFAVAGKQNVALLI
jgi:hypothetical protein